MSEPAFWTDLVQRGVIQQTTSPTLGEWLAARLATGGKVPVYCGFDPTADSLHIGSLMPVLGLRRLKNAGLFPIALVGGATGMIGDPSGKTTERTLLDSDRLAANVAGLTKQLESLLDGKVGEDFLLVNNADWFGPIRMVDFLRDIGKHFSVNMMVAKESVRARLEDRDHGISYTEFSYMLLQAYDFLHLFQTHDCRLQVGGSDQWGNITAGIDLIRHKHHGAEVQGATFPLLTTASGQKFGKSERGNIWIDPKRTHPYFLYKYFFHADDADVVRFLKFLTFLSLDAIAELEKEVQGRPEQRAAQKALALETTAIVHGRDVAVACEGLELAMHQDDAGAFEQHASALGLLDPNAIANAEDLAALPVTHRSKSEFAGEGIAAIDLGVDLGLFKSKSDARREVQSPNSGYWIGDKQVTSADLRVSLDLIGNRRVVQVRKGKKSKRMLCLHGD